MSVPHSLEHTRYDVSDGVATVTLNRPEKMNAWTGTMDQFFLKKQQLLDEKGLKN